ncbi:MAG TPA: PASTA domain-containing protein [Chitinophagales bacterium]|nr:PASTA domain-containing protein [Chitinophagales bacterium]HMU69481.1 PASTA domain-containing protein [Chitinophagales bacterium]HMX05210.1 PASTA domain-containing protein [Chitinophagales bacterium]HMZ90352.1 PASTA domain-containing protein [Chitinophagales bacterium]HNA58188.1 PASTA domain-containing protein [Chitinophagales bacterium]
MSKKKQSSPESPGFLRFLMSKVFWLNVFGALVVAILLMWGTLFFIQQYSRHGESQTVPNLIGKTTSEALNELDNLDLEYAVMDSTFDPDERPLTILNQDPLPDSKVKSGRTIYVTVNMKQAPKTEIPRFEVGTSFISVREILESHGLKVGEIIYKPFEYRDVYLDMRVHGEKRSLKPGTMIAKGTKIDVVLGNGLGDTKVIIPDLTGLTYIEAANLIQLKELSLGTVIAAGAISDSADAMVYKQFPTPGIDNAVNLGSMIDIWITDDPALLTPSSNEDQ